MSKNTGSFLVGCSFLMLAAVFTSALPVATNGVEFGYVLWALTTMTGAVAFTVIPFLFHLGVCVVGLIDDFRFRRLAKASKRFESANARAFKLMKKRKPFIVIANDEPYFEQAYGIIRENEKKAGRWTPYDELCYRRAISEAAKQSKEPKADA